MLESPYPFVRTVESPLTADQLAPLDPRCRVVQFSAPLTEEDLASLARFLEAYPQIPLRIFGHYQGASNLSFLRYFPSLQGFQADVYEIESWEGLHHLPPTLKFLGLGPTRRRFSLSPLARFEELTDLALDGHRKDLAVIGDLRALGFLTLRSITLPDLKLLSPLRKLRGLALRLGGTNQIDGLRDITSLRYLELWRVRGMTDLSAVAALPELRYLFLQDLKQVPSLPSFGPLGNLRRCDIDSLQSLIDLASIAQAPALEELMLANMKHITVDGLSCFRDHPSLKAVSIGLGSQRRNRQAVQLLGLPTVTEIKPITRYL